MLNFLLKSYFWNKELDELKVGKMKSSQLWVNGGRLRDDNNKYLWIYKQGKKVFLSMLQHITKEYENKEMLAAV